MNALTLIPGQLSLSQLRDVYSQPLNITLDESAFAAIDDSVACVNAILAEGRTAYGINTGFARWRKPVSPPKTWKISSAHWYCRMRRGSANRWMTISRV